MTEQFPTQAQTLPKFTRDQITTYRQKSDDSSLMGSLYNLDPEFKARVDRLKPALSSLDEYSKKRFPTNVINKHYFGAWELSEVDPVQDSILQASIDSSQPAQPWMQTVAGGIRNLYDFATSPVRAAAGAIGAVAAPIAGATGLPSIKEAIQRTPVVQNLKKNVSQTADALPVLGGIAGAPGGPLGSGFGAGVGQAAKHGLKQLIGEESNDLSALPGQALDVAATTLMTTATDAALRAAPSAIKNTLKGRAAEKQAAKDAVIQKLVQPAVTKKTVQEAVRTGRGSEGGLLKSKQTLPPTDAEKKLAETAKTIPDFGKSKSAVKNANIVHTTIGDESKSLRQAMKANDAVIPRKEADAAVSRAVQKAAKEFGDQQGIFESTANVWKQISSKHPGTASGTWQARIEFYKEMRDRFGESVFEKGTARADAVRVVGGTVNDVIDQATAKAGVSFRPQMDRLSQMYDILDNLSSQTGKETLKSGAAKTLKTPLGKAAGAAAAGAVGLKAIDTLSQ